MKLKMYYQNVREICETPDNFYKETSSNSYDIICLTEPWLTPNMYSGEFFDERYKVFRRDKTIHRSVQNTSGEHFKNVNKGICLAVRLSTCYTAIERLDLHVNNADDLWITLEPTNSECQLTFCVFNMPLTANVNYLNAFFRATNTAVNKNPTETFVLLGNCGTSSRKMSTQFCFKNETLTELTCSQVFYGLCKINALCCRPFDVLSQCKLSQCSVFSDMKLTVEHNIEPMVQVNGSQSSPLTLHMNVNFDKPQPTYDVIVIDKKRSEIDWDSIIAALFAVNWKHVLTVAANVDQMIEIFHQHIECILDVFGPVTINQKKKKHPLWFSQQTITLLKKKKKRQFIWRQTGAYEDYITCQDFVRKSKHSVSSDYETFLFEVEKSRTSNNSQLFDKFINSRKNDRCGNTTGSEVTAQLETHHDSTKHCSGEEFVTNHSRDTKAANLLARQFESIFESAQIMPTTQTAKETHPGASEKTDIVPSVKQFTAGETPRCRSLESQTTPKTEKKNSWTHFFISLHTIRKKLCKLHSGKTRSNVDKLPPIFYKICARALVFPLWLIYNKSIKNGVFPSTWKHTNVTAVHKGGSMHSAKNYRPISKLSVPAKVFDSIIADELERKIRKIVIPEQHGFIPGRSTITNLNCFTKKLKVSLQTSNQVDVIYTDFSKAFDKIDRKLLLLKLKNVGIGGNMLSWFKSYFTGRTQSVRVANSYSQAFAVSSSLLQGSHLAPVLFLLYINDIGRVLHNVEFCVYADDIKMWKTIDRIEDAHSLQNTFSQFENWVDKNKMSLNLNKCSVLSFTSNSQKTIEFPYSSKIDNANNNPGKVLERKYQVRDLGLMYDNALNFSLHIDHICKKAHNALDFLTRTSCLFKKLHTVTALYTNYVRPCLEYASVVWNPLSQPQIKQIEQVQQLFQTYLAQWCFQQKNTFLQTQFSFTVLALTEQKIKTQTLETRRDKETRNFWVETNARFADQKNFARMTFSQWQGVQPGFSRNIHEQQFKKDHFLRNMKSSDPRHNSNIQMF